MSISSIEQIVNTTITQAEQIAGDQRYADTHKQAEVTGVRDRALATLDERANGEIQRLEAVEAEQIPRAAVSFAPSAAAFDDVELHPRRPHGALCWAKRRGNHRQNVRRVGSGTQS